MNTTHNGVLIPAELRDATPAQLDAYASRVKQENGAIVRAYCDLEDATDPDVFEPERVMVNASRGADGTLRVTCALDTRGLTLDDLERVDGTPERSDDDDERDAAAPGAHEREVRVMAERLRSMARRHAGRHDTIGPAMLDAGEALDAIAGELYAAARATDITG